jgi:hypothetical protein
MAFLAHFIELFHCAYPFLPTYKKSGTSFATAFSAPPHFIPKPEMLVLKTGVVTL